MIKKAARESRPGLPEEYAGSVSDQPRHTGKNRCNRYNGTHDTDGPLKRPQLGVKPFDPGGKWGGSLFHFHGDVILHRVDDLGRLLVFYIDGLEGFEQGELHNRTHFLVRGQKPDPFGSGGRDQKPRAAASSAAARSETLRRLLG